MPAACLGSGAPSTARGEGQTVWQNTSKGRGNGRGEEGFWNGFPTVSPTSFIPASVPPHVLSLCRQQSVLHDETSGWIPSPAQPGEHGTRTRQGGTAGRQQAGEGGGQLCLSRHRWKEQRDCLTMSLAGCWSQICKQSNCGCVRFNVLLSLSYR